MERPGGVAIATLLLLMTTTACGAATAPMLGGSPPGAARERPPAAASWAACFFPEEADRKGIDNATVVLWVHVEPDGSARTVQILHDPGNGFGRAAAQCAMRARYAPGKDRSGAPRAMWTPPITVRFVREPAEGAARWRRRAGPWPRCPFPEEAERGGVDRGTVVLRVYVETDGSARWVQVLHDPGNGFGQAAVACAMHKRYLPGKDASGMPLAAWTAPFAFLFARERP
ncbi:hypothetical protein BE08_45435 [Sorangium cellulosum]|uniref:TonB C-terminal domain-containing protein n=1 Tax=Sorangium cellulosum TaxID=56 RepID=A0A150P759_SORCE|nr:hypothetical protein BE08_45435 [Sorangium cellulosum]